MKFTTKIRYGIRVMFELARHYPSGKAVFQKDIAVAQNLSVKYLDVIIDSLRNAGLLTNYSGKRSGYMLTRPASEITILDIHNAFSDGLYVIECLSPHVNCEIIDKCPTIDFWENLNELVNTYFRKNTLQNLLDKEITKKV